MIKDTCLCRKMPWMGDLRDLSVLLHALRRIFCPRAAAVVGTIAFSFDSVKGAEGKMSMGGRGVLRGGKGGKWDSRAYPVTYRRTP